jgi:hypothetical protein
MFKFIHAIITAFPHPPAANWPIEKQEKPAKTHPLSEFWKKSQSHYHGPAIGKVPEGLYSNICCGAGDCFKKGT